MEKELKPTLELKDEISLHVTGWIVQRTGWALLLLTLIAAAAGVFGTGWLSKQSITRGAEAVIFERFVRYENPTTVTIHTEAQEEVQVSMPQAFVQNFELDKVMPEPDRQETSGGQTVFVFPANGPIEIRFYLIPEKTGRLNGNIKVNDSSFEVSQFVYP